MGFVQQSLVGLGVSERLEGWHLHMIAAAAVMGAVPAMADVFAYIAEKLFRVPESLLDRSVDAASPSVVSAYETRLAKLEREKFVLSEKAVSALPPKGRLEESIELSLKFLASPWNIYKNCDYATRQTVLRLAFVEPLQYRQNQDYRTPEICFPFKVLEEIKDGKKLMVL